MKWMPIAILAVASLSQMSQGVVQSSGNTNHTAPGGQPYFNNIGTLNGASAIYLANGWAMTANHVASSLPATVVFGGVGYGTKAGSFRRLENPFPMMSTFTDIVLFRLNAPPALPALGISTSTPTVGSEVMMIGNGRIQQATETDWDRSVLPGDGDDIWVETSPGLGTNSGYKTTGSNEVRWGENVVNASLFLVNVGTVPVPQHVISFSTQFDEAALMNEAQAVVGDSGGGVFSLTGGAWELSGMMYAVNLYENQPGGAESAIYGDQTFIADLAYYRPQIMAIIPEPSSLVVSLVGACLFGRRRR